MLQIRNDQMLAFQSDRHRRFDDSLVAHVKTYFASHFEAQGEACVRRTAHLAQKRAAAYGFQDERSVFLYLTVVYMYGLYFDEDRLLPWVGDILVDKPAKDVDSTIDKLADEALIRFQKITGDGQRSLFRTLSKVKKELPRLLSESDGSEFEIEMAQRLYKIDPRRHDAFGSDAVLNLIRDSRLKTSRYGLFSQEGNRLFVLAAFMLGSHFDNDPMWERINRHLKDSAVTEENDRVLRIYVELNNIADIFLKSWI